MIRWILIGVFFLFSLLFATQFYACSRKNTLLIATRDEYCRHLEKELKKQLEEGQKKTQFIRNAYHEVRSHFWGVIVISRILAKEGQMGYVSNRNKMLHDLLNAGNNLELLLANILNYARYDVARYAAHDKNLRLETHISDEIPDHVVCDRMPGAVLPSSCLLSYPWNY